MAEPTHEPGTDPREPAAVRRALRAVAVVEDVVVFAVLLLVLVLVVESAIEVAWLVASRIVRRPLGLIEAGRLLDAFGAILLVLIGLELLASVRVYLRDHVLHLAVVLEVALVAVARKAIVLDLEKYDGITLLGLGVLVAALAFAAYLQPSGARGTLK